MSDYFPLEMVGQVLLRLPIKPLLRCSTTCKAWYNLITTSQFISAHLYSKSLHTSRRLLIEYRIGNYVLYSDDKAGTFEEHNRFEFPIENSASSISFVGCCNGLICLAYSAPITSRNGDSETYAPHQKVILWNPIIQKSVHLPKSEIQFRCELHNTFGFVFHHSDVSYIIHMSVQPLGFRKNGEILWVVSGTRLISTHLQDASSANYQNTLCYVYSCSYYVESLVLLDSS